MTKNTTSKEIIKYLKTNLNKKYYESMFTAGSLPEKLIPKSDLDIFIIIKNEYINPFFDNLNLIMKEFTKKNKSVIYELFRGPIRHRNKGLIHFMVYTQKPTETPEDHAPFMEEHYYTIRSLMKTANIISGKKLRSIVDLKKLKKEESGKAQYARSMEKYKIILKENIAPWREWTKTKKGWKLIKKNRRLNNFFREYLIKYYKKSFNI